VQTRGVPDEALAVLTELQPFNQARYGAQRAEYHTLAILQALQNADKHRQLIVKGHAIKQMTVWLPEPLSSFSFVVARGSGARILTADEKLEVKADGVFCVPMSTGRNEGFEIPFSIDRVLDFTAQQILPNLEPLLPDPII
jgi:hypothetical protein